MKVIIVQMLELAARGGKKFLAGPHIGVHRSTHIEKHQHLNRVMTLGDHTNIE